jgi:hypothetical protein
LCGGDELGGAIRSAENHANTPIYLELVKHFAAFSYPVTRYQHTRWLLGGRNLVDRKHYPDALVEKAPISDHIESSRMRPRGFRTG